MLPLRNPQRSLFSSIIGLDFARPTPLMVFLSYIAEKLDISNFNHKITLVSF